MALSEQVHVYLYIPFFFSFGAWVLFFPHSKSLRANPEVKFVFTPAFLREAFNWLAMVGTYLMQAKSLSSSLFNSTLRKGRISKSSFVWERRMARFCCMVWSVCGRGILVSYVFEFFTVVAIVFIKV